MGISASPIQSVFRANDAAFVAACDAAEARSYHSYFNQHVVSDGVSGFIAVDEGDYEALPADLAGRVVETIPGKLSDES